MIVLEFLQTFVLTANSMSAAGMHRISNALVTGTIHLFVSHSIRFFPFYKI